MNGRYLCSECGAPAVVRGFTLSDSAGERATAYGWSHVDGSEAADCANTRGDREAFAILQPELPWCWHHPNGCADAAAGRDCEVEA